MVLDAEIVKAIIPECNMLPVIEIDYPEQGSDEPSAPLDVRNCFIVRQRIHTKVESYGFSYIKGITGKWQ